MSSTIKLCSIVLSAGAALAALIGYLYMKSKKRNNEKFNLILKKGRSSSDELRPIAQNQQLFKAKPQTSQIMSNV